MTDSAVHPDELLALYVEGGLDDADRTAVEEHLAGCDRCREEAGLAAEARRALGALPEVDLPPRTLQPVIREIDRVGSGGRPLAPVPDEGPGPGESSSAWSASAPGRSRTPLAERMRPFGGLAAAAAVVLLLILAVPPLLRGGSEDEAGSGAAVSAPEGAKAADQSAPMPAPVPERQDVDYDADRVASLAAEAARSRSNASGGGDVEQGSASFEALTGEEAAAVTSCTERWAAAADARSHALRWIEARYEGEPAFLGVYLLDEAGKTPEKVAVWVLSPKGCELIRFSTQRV